MTRHPARIALSAVAFLVLALPTRSAPVDLADVMPDGALLYVGWAGHDQLAAAAKTTALGQTLADPQLQRCKSQIIDLVNAIIAKAPDPDAPQTAAAAKRLLHTLYRRPAALAVFDFGIPYAYGAVIVHTGPDSQTFLTDFQSILAKTSLPPPQPFTIGDAAMYRLDVPFPGGLFYGLAKDHFLFIAGLQHLEKILATLNATAPALAANPRFQAARQKTTPPDATRALTLYLDVESLLQRLDMLLPVLLPRDAQTRARIPAVLKALGLDNLQSLCWELHLRDQGYVNASYLQFSSPRAGLFTACPDTPLTDADLAVIPKSPSWASAFNMNPSRLYATILAAIQAFNPQIHQAATQAVTEAETSLGLQFDKDLLDLLGDTFVFFDAPDNGGLWVTGITLVVDSSDPARLQTNLTKLVQALADKIEQPKKVFSVSSFPYRDHTIHFINTVGAPIPVAPAWTAHDNRLIVALYPQMVITTLDRLLDANPQTDSILANPHVAQALKRLGPIGSSFSYSDTGASLRSLYCIALPLAQMGAAMAQGEDVPIDISAFPTQQALTRYMFPNVSTARSDDQGILCTSYGPLPVAIPSLGALAPAATAGVLAGALPALSRARAISKRTVSGAYLRSIGMASIIYANDHNGQFPPNLQTLVDQQQILEKQLHAPTDPTDQVSYIYIAGQNANVDPRNVLAHERTDLNNGQGVNVLFADTHVRFMDLQSFQKALAETQSRLATTRPAPAHPGAHP